MLHTDLQKSEICGKYCHLLILHELFGKCVSKAVIVYIFHAGMRNWSISLHELA